MEIPNRVVGIIGVTAALAIVAYRIQADHSQTTAVGDLAVASSSNASPSSLNTRPLQSRSSSSSLSQRTFANDSPMPPDNSNFVKNGDRPPANDSNVPSDQASDYNAQNDAQPQVNVNTQDLANPNDTPQDDQVQDPDVSLNLSVDGQSGLPRQLNDQQVFDQMMSWLNTEEREAFVEMWIEMSPADRADLIESMRDATGGY